MVNIKPFGKTNEGKEISLYTIENGNFSAAVTDYGANWVSFLGPDKSGKRTDILLGFSSGETYLGRVGNIGATVGRFANRIEDGKFTLNGKEYKLVINNGKNHIHGGVVGFSRKMYSAKCFENAVQLTYISPDGEEGYPGELTLSILFSLSADGTFSIDYTATTTEDTILNITNHAYFNLNGADKTSNIKNHLLKLNADSFCEADETGLVTGRVLETKGTEFDFSEYKNVGKVMESGFLQAALADGLDHNFVINGDGFREAGRVYSSETGIELICSTDRPGVQLFTGKCVSEDWVGKYNTNYCKYAGICLETQGFPNSMKWEHFPSPILRKDDVFKSKTTYKFSVK